MGNYQNFKIFLKDSKVYLNGKTSLVVGWSDYGITKMSNFFINIMSIKYQ